MRTELYVNTQFVELTINPVKRGRIAIFCGDRFLVSSPSPRMARDVDSPAQGMRASLPPG